MRVAKDTGHNYDKGCDGLEEGQFEKELKNPDAPMGKKDLNKRTEPSWRPRFTVGDTKIVIEALKALNEKEPDVFHSPLSRYTILLQRMGDGLVELDTPLTDTVFKKPMFSKKLKFE